MKTLSACLTLVAVVALSGCGVVSNPEAEAKAIESAVTWVEIIDGGEYAKSWEEAASFFKGAVKQEEWVKSMQSFRKPFGKNLSRELKSKRYLTTMPGAPDGEYVIIQFKASFENKKSAIETITPMLDSDGQWRVSGYYMK